MALVSRIDTVFVPALDTELAAQWYASVFGMVEVYRSEGFIGLRFDGVGAPSTALTLMPVDKMPELGFATFNFFSSDLDALLTHFDQEGIEVVASGSEGAMRWVDFFDIAGNRINICHFPES